MKGIAEIITVTGYINVDFADVETVMKNSGVALMGMGIAQGENRAINAIENALASPLLNSNDITGAKSILINISSGKGENELTMDELGEITDFMYESASEDALIIRGLSQDESLGENISVIVIATGFEANSIFQPYRPTRKSTRVELLQETPAIPEVLSRSRQEDEFVVHKKGKKSIITDLEEEMQGVIDFNLVNSDTVGIVHNRTENAKDEEQLKSEATLRKVKHMQKILQKEGLSNKTMNENIETFEEVPAYIRRNMSLGDTEKPSESKLSKFTLTSDDEEGPVLRENNAYLNDNVD